MHHRRVPGFDLFYVLTNGGPYNATEIPTTYLVKVVFRNQDVGYGSALAVVISLVVLAVGPVYVRIRRRATAAASGHGMKRVVGSRSVFLSVMVAPVTRMPSR